MADMENIEQQLNGATASMREGLQILDGTETANQERRTAYEKVFEGLEDLEGLLQGAVSNAVTTKGNYSAAADKFDTAQNRVLAVGSDHPAMQQAHLHTVDAHSRIDAGTGGLMNAVAAEIEAVHEVIADIAALTGRLSIAFMSAGNGKYAREARRDAEQANKQMRIYAGEQGIDGVEPL